MSILVVLATFLAAGVEWVEALTIVLAVGLTRGWRSALTGTVIALVVLIGLVAVFGYAIVSHVPISGARTVVGVFLLLFGLKWLHKAILRSSGLKSLHDEGRIFEETKSSLTTSLRTSPSKADRSGIATAFGGVFLEGLEVVFIVVALGGLQNDLSATLGALASLVVVTAAGIGFRHPLTRVPENAMKYVVGVMLTAFGTFFAGEGIGVQWWQNDLSLLPLIGAYGVASIVCVVLLKWFMSNPVHSQAWWLRSIRSVMAEIVGLFVDDSALAIVAIAALLAIAVYTSHVSTQRGLAGILLVVGVMLAIVVGLMGAFRATRAAATTHASAAHADAAEVAIPHSALMDGASPIFEAPRPS